MVGRRNFIRPDQARCGRAVLFEIISEASRYIPEHVRGRFADIPWIDIRNIGNILRHGYDGVTFETLLLIARTEIHDLETAIDRILAEEDAAGH